MQDAVSRGRDGVPAMTRMADNRTGTGLAMPVLLLAAVLLAGCRQSGGLSPLQGAVVLNEVDCHGRDWIEVVNTSAAAIDVSGWAVADDFTKEGHQYVLQSGTVLAPGDHVVFRQQLDLEAGFTFGIGCGKDTVYLLDADEAVVDQEKVGVPPDGSTWGRMPDARGAWQETGPTAGGGNQPPPSAAAVLFDPKAVGHVAITLPSDSIASLKAAPLNFTQGQVQVTAGDVVHDAVPAGIRLTGDTSFRPLGEKASFEIRFDTFDATSRLLGLKGFLLDGMVGDPAMMRQALAYTVFRAAGLPASRTGYARVTVNGEEYGLHAVIEACDDVFAGLHFASTAHVYRGIQDITPQAVDGFEVAAGDADDRQDLLELATTVQDFADADWQSAVSMRLDLDAFIALWVVENYVGQSDGYVAATRNYFLHGTAEGVFTMLPFGLQGTFIDAPSPTACTGLLCTRCLAIPACRSKVAPALAAVVAVVETLALDQVVTDIEGVIAPFVADEPFGIVTVAGHQDAIGQLRAFLVARAASAAASAAAAP